MANNYLQAGNVADHTAAADIASGDLVNMNGVLGVALVDIATGETGSVQISGVWVLPKVTTAVIAQGEEMLWDASAGAFDVKGTTPSSGDVLGGAVAFSPAANGDTTVQVKLTGVPGTVTA